MDSNPAVRGVLRRLRRLERHKMKNRARLNLEANLATARRAMFRAITEAEILADYGLEEDLHQINKELERVYDSILPKRMQVRTPVD